MTFAAIIRQVHELAAEKPLLCVLEDMHWADPTTAELIDLLIESIKQLPVFLIVTVASRIEPGLGGAAARHGPGRSAASTSGLRRR